MSKDPYDEHVVILPDGEELRLSYDPQDGQQEQETLIEVDPLIQEFLRSPYDPVIGAAAMGRLTGEAIRNPPRGTWYGALSVLTALTCLMMAVSALGWLYAGGETELGGFRFELYKSLLVSLPFALGGLLLLWRLARR